MREYRIEMVNNNNNIITHTTLTTHCIISLHNIIIIVVPPDWPFRHHTAPVSCVTSALDNSIVISGSDDSSIIIASLETGKLVSRVDIIVHTQEDMVHHCNR